MKKAVVLGGGGPVGIAWETGIIAGLESAGILLGKADFILGTSAGSMVGAQIASGWSAISMVETEMKQAETPPKGNDSSGPSPNLDQLMEFMLKASSEDPLQHWKKIGGFALTAKTISEDTFLSYFKDIAGVGHWPENYFCTAINVKDGSFKLWNKNEDVELQKAVTSSCAVPGIFPPITIKGDRYMDGGMASATNATLAKGHDRVVILSVMTEEMQKFMGNPLEKEVHILEAAGSKVMVISPDTLSVEAFGPNLMDNSRRSSVAKAGLRQGKAEALKLHAIWD
ncbi:MAG: hypothetical protein FP816_21600 [Desulfobacteraceae bacterium]|nr:hypothetical protein [Desulfobacteraceae bacterium]MBU4053100.1 patatin-like phospholipase family protein [Pseudomonadota bacterium]